MDNRLQRAADAAEGTIRDLIDEIEQLEKEIERIGIIHEQSEAKLQARIDELEDKLSLTHGIPCHICGYIGGHYSNCTCSLHNPIE